MSINTKKIERLKTFFLIYPPVLNLYAWEVETEYGTVGCTAGWTCMLEGITFPSTFPDCLKWVIEAKNILGINDTCLFYTVGWPSWARSELSRYEPGSLEYTKVVCEVIDYYVEVGIK